MCVRTSASPTLRLLCRREEEAVERTRFAVGLGIFGVAWTTNFVYLKEEWGQARAGLGDYLSSFFNIIDAALVFSTALSAPLILCGWPESARMLGATTDLLLMVKVGKLSRGNDGMSFLLSMLGAILHDMASFAVVIVTALSFSTAAFMILAPPYNDAYRTIFDGLCSSKVSTSTSRQARYALPPCKELFQMAHPPELRSTRPEPCCTTRWP